MLDVDIHNFQSIDHVHLRVEGFTALVGRSNIGKSAIVRAVKAALTGAPEDNYVRHGPNCEKVTKGNKSCKCFCTVHLKSEGFDLLWRKGGDKNEYVFNGQSYTAANKGTPDFLEAGFGSVAIGDRKILLQVSDQFRSEGGGPIFLLDEYGAVVADVLSDVAQLDSINVATRMAEKDRRDCVAQRKVREKDVIELRMKVESYDGLDDVLVRARSIEAEEKRVGVQRARRDRVKGFKDAVLTIGPVVKALMSIPNLAIPEVASLGEQNSKVRKIAVFILLVEARQGVVATLAGVEDVVPPAVDPIHAAWKKADRLSGWLGKLRTYKAFFVNWKGVEEAPIPDARDIKERSKRLGALGAYRQRQSTLETQVGTLERQLSEMEKEYQAVKDEEASLGVCPTCTQPVTLDHDHAAE